MFTTENPFKLGLTGLGIGQSIGIPAINLVSEIQLVAIHGRRTSVVDSLSNTLNGYHCLFLICLNISNYSYLYYSLIALS